MIKVNKTILGFDIEVDIASTIEEAIELCGGGEAGKARLLALANNNILAHSHFGKARRKICDKLEAITKDSGNEVKRVVANKETGTKTEKEEVYVARVAQTLGEDFVKANAQTIVDMVNAMPVDYTATVREAADTTPAKRYFDMVANLRAANALDGFVAKHAIDLADCETDEDRDLAIAQFIKKIVLESEREAKKAALSKLGV